MSSGAESDYLHDAVLPWYKSVLAVTQCLSVTSWCSFQTVGQIELVVGMEASFHQFYAVY